MACTQNLTLTLVSQDLENNTSVVRVNWTTTQTGASHNDANKVGYWYSSVNGGAETSHTVYSTLPSNTTKTIVNTTITVPHNNDGEASFKVRTSFATGISAGTIALSKTIQLPTIPRASKLTIPPMTLGETSNIEIVRVATEYTDTIEWSCGTESGTILTKSSATSFSFTPPETLSAQFPELGKVPITFTVTTYNGDSLVATKTIVAEASLPSSLAPDITVTISPRSSVEWISSKTYFVGGYSYAHIETTASGKEGATIESITIQGLGDGGEGASWDSAVLPIGEYTVVVTVTDSRGLIKTYSQSIEAVEYNPPSVTGLNYIRGHYVNGVWTDSAVGGDLKVVFNLAISLSENSAICTIKLDDVEVSSHTETTSGAKTYYVTNAGTATVRTLSVIVSDSIASVTAKSITVATVIVPFNIDPLLPSVAFGGVANKENTVQLLNGWTLDVSEGNVEGLPEPTDYVIEEGTSGVWGYRKWKSGIGECWAYISKNSSGITEFTATTPFGLIDPAVTVSGGAASITTSWVAYTNYTAQNIVDIYMNGNNSSTRLHWVRVHCIGVIKT